MSFVSLFYEYFLSKNIVRKICVLGSKYNIYFVYILRGNNIR